MRLPARRIHLSDTDATGVAYAVRLVDIAVQRFEEALARRGVEVADLAHGRAGPAVVRLETDFHRPARLGEALGAGVSCTRVGDTSAVFTVALGPARTPACTVTVVLVWVDREAGRSAPWPPAVRRRLAGC